MLTRRIIPCLDVRGDRVVKGVQFENLRDMGDPKQLAARYAQEGADELCFLNVSSTIDDSDLTIELLEQLSTVVFIPFTVGGGVRSVEDAYRLLRAGADKIAINSAALADPTLLTRLADEFGSQCVVLSIDTRLGDDDWFVTSHSATRSNSRRCIDWALEGVERGAGEILLNVINADGGESGFALDITGEVAQRVQVPVIGSGGAGSPQDFVELFRATEASAGLAATIFHDGRWTPQSLKQELSREGIEVRR